MKDKLKVCWVVQENDVMGNALGYSTHNKMMRRYSAPYLDFDNNALLALTITPADHFNPVPGKFNILFSMFEFMDLPKTYVENMHRADAIIVPCSFCKDLFRKYTNLPIDVCWEGIDSNRFKFHQRKMPERGERFRFLWVGAPNPRKGYPLILEAIKLIEQIPEWELYISTTVQPISFMGTLKTVWRRRKEIFRGVDGGSEREAFWRQLRRCPRPSLHNKMRVFGKHKNIIFDTCYHPGQELIDLYNSAHCFVLPTFGEGWGLTLCEALGTGAPCIAPRHTGTADFFDDSVGYVIRHAEVEQELANYDLKTVGFIPDTKDMIQKMIAVYGDYDRALRKGQTASERIHRKFTWQNSAKRLYEILKKHETNAMAGVM